MTSAIAINMTMDACISLAKRWASVASFASRHLVEDALTDSVDVVGVEATVTADVVVSLAEATDVVEGVGVVGVEVDEAVVVEVVDAGVVDAGVVVD